MSIWHHLSKRAFSAPFLAKADLGSLDAFGFGGAAIDLIGLAIVDESPWEAGPVKPYMKMTCRFWCRFCKGKVAIKRIAIFWWKILCWASPQANLVVGGVARLHEAVGFGGKSPLVVVEDKWRLIFLWQMIGLSTQKAPGTFEHWVSHFSWPSQYKFM